ncbi:helix-turn-helix domain-containing protein [Patescibacteria group bacterium]
MAKPVLRIKARNLREKLGLSIKEIEKQLGVSRSTISLWCRDIKLNPHQLKRLEKRERDGGFKGRQRAAYLSRKKRLTKVNKLHIEATKEISKLTKRDLFLVGVALYWAEGDKKHRSMNFANSDPEMIKLFLWWLQEICEIPLNRIKCNIGINKAHESRIEEVEKFWSKLTGIPRNQFNKASIKKVANIKKYRNYHNHFGTLTLRVLKGTDLNYKTLGWIKAIKAQAG